MPVHKIILGGEQYLPLALKELRKLAKQAAGGYASRKLDFGAATAQIRVAGEQHFLKLEGGAANYEFYTSEHFGNEANGSFGWELLQGPLTPETAPAVAGHVTRLLIRGAALPVPVLSHTLTPPVPTEGVPPKWLYEPNARLTLPSPSVTTASGYNRQRLGEHITWQPKGFMFSTLGMARGYGSTANRYSMYHAFRLSNSWAQMSDLGQDIVPTLVDQIKTTKGGKTVATLRTRASEPVFDQPWVYSRHAATQGEFIICTDNFGRFYIYKTPPAIVDPVPGQYTQVGIYWIETPPYPTWVTLPDVNDELAHNRAWLWEFSSDGKRAVACPFHTTDGVFQTNGDKLGMLTPYLLSQIDSGAIDPASLRPSKEDTPGLVEFGIEITSTGPGPGDLDVKFTLLRNDYFGDSKRFIFNAAYSLPDKSKAGMGVDGARLPKDTLITAEVELFAPMGFYQAGPSSPLPHPAQQIGDPVLFLVDSVKHAEAYIVLKAEAAYQPAPPNEPPPEPTPPTEMRKLLLFKGFMSSAFIETGAGYAYGYGGYDTYYKAADQALAPPEVSVDVRLSGFSSLDVFPKSPPPPWPTVGYAFVTGFVNSLELRTLSVSHTTYDTYTGMNTSQLFAYNEEAVKTGYSNGDIRPADPTKTSEATQRVNSRAHCINMLGNWMDVSPWAGFSVHPKGHWAHCTTGYSPSLDVIQPFGGKRTMHREMFNKAFGQARGDDYYNWTQTEFAGLVWPYGSGSSWKDRGAFRVAGHWFDI